MTELRQVSISTHYLAGSDGNIYRKVYSKYAKNYPMKKVGFLCPAYGYMKVFIRADGDTKKRCIGVHCVIATAFHGEKPHDCDVVRHLDGNKLNNRPENLAWGTFAENASDCVTHGTYLGSNNGRAIVSESDVREIRKMRANDMTYQSIADTFGISNSNAQMIARGHTWSHIT